MTKIANIAILVTASVLLLTHIIFAHPFTQAADASALCGLFFFWVQAVIRLWRWADLFVKKLFLWISNASVNWTLHVSVEVEDTIESVDVELLKSKLGSIDDLSRITYDALNEVINFYTKDSYSIAIQPLHSPQHASWLIRFNPVFIGYRDASRVLSRDILPLLDKILGSIEGRFREQYSIEARFKTTNPYAAVLLNDLRAQNADKMLISFKQDGANIQLTKATIISSCNNQLDAQHSIATIFSISHKGAFDAGHF